MKIRKIINWNMFFLLGAVGLVLVLFISSSMPYTKQTAVPFLETHLSKQPFATELQGIAFSYAGKEISIANLGYYRFVEFFIRKGAHFGTYFLLGGAIFLGIGQGRYKIRQRVVFSWVLATGYAAFDELHQMVTGGRTPLVQDVILDSVGALVGIGLSVLLLKKVRRSKA